MKKTTASAKWAPIWLPLILAGNITTSMGETPLVLKDEDLRRTITRRFVDLSVAVPPVNLESPQSHPLALGPNGQWLAAVNTYGDRIELFELVDGTPQHRRSIHTGLDRSRQRTRLQKRRSRSQLKVKRLTAGTDFTLSPYLFKANPGIHLLVDNWSSK